jgi:hypothetical protein
MYTEAVQWFAAAHLIPQTCRIRWEQVSGPGSGVAGKERLRRAARPAWPDSSQRT